MPSKEVAAEILESAIAYVKNGWTKYSLARDPDGHPVPCTNTDAAFFCIDGAISRAAWERRDWVNDILAIRAIEELEKCRINVLNDELIRNVDEAVKVMEKGVENLRRPRRRKPVGQSRKRPVRGAASRPARKR